MNPEALKDKKILLVDDHPKFIYLVEILLSELGFVHVHTANNFEAALQIFIEEQPDLCMLDIDLGIDQPNGIKLAEKIRSNDEYVPIVFLTSNYSGEYYEQCRHVRPSSFLSKEISSFKIQLAIELALLQLHSDRSEISPSANDQKEQIFIKRKNLFFKIGDYYKNIRPEEISYFFAENKLTYARVSGRNYPTTIQLKTLEAELSSDFQRIHKKYLANINHIDQINTKEDRILIDDTSLPIGYTYKKDFLSRIKLLK